MLASAVQSDSSWQTYGPLVGVVIGGLVSSVPGIIATRSKNNRFESRHKMEDGRKAAERARRVLAPAMNIVQVCTLVLDVVKQYNGVVPDRVWVGVMDDYSASREAFLRVSGEFGIEPGLDACREASQNMNGLITNFLTERSAGRWTLMLLP